MPVAPARRAGDLLAWLRNALEAERDRWFLWLPVFLGSGIGLYFTLTVEPPLWLGLLAAPVAVALALIARWRQRFVLVAVALSAMAVGFAAAEIETRAAAAPVLERRLGPVPVEGRVVEAEPLPAGLRILVEPTQIGRLASDQLPARIRIKLRDGEGAPLPGEGIAVRATLLPPPAPAMPGAYDFQRRAYFDRLGAVGYAVGAVRELPGEAPPAWRVRLAALRAEMTRRIQAALPGRTGAIAAAIITGETHAIPEADAQAFRDAGLAHILVIAGLHMGMVAGIAFFAIRFGLALFPYLALRLNTKKWAAGGALMVTFVYLLLSGITVSSRRSFVMTALVLLAVLIDRMSVSARGLALAALVIMLWSPFAVTGPSFQMSFAAVAGLVAFYETFRERISAGYRDAGHLRRWGLHALGIVLTTVVSTVATTPFTVFHFNRFPIYSVAANILAVPITGLWVMPWAILACVLMPFGAEKIALVPMGWGIDVIAEIAHGVTSWPGAALTLPSMPVWGLMVLSLGGVWLCLWRGRWRLLGLAPIAAGYLTLLLPRPPDVLVDSESRVMAVRAANGAYLASTAARAGLAEETWTRRAAVAAGPAWPKSGSSDDGTLSCDAEACLYRARGRVVAFDRAPAALAEDCGKVDLIVTPVPARGGCRETPVIDRFDTWRNGSYAIWLGPERIAIESVRDWRGQRPWVPWRPPERAAATAAAPSGLVP
ncbi:MAG TPA: ComEC/Rec2 family competence protein [Stellaceae bacterium]|nr:ComEC/Rec2 family competence protein [Stellaceae bacterium]